MSSRKNFTKFSKSKSETWRLWKLYREDGTKGFLVTEDCKPVAFFKGTGAVSLRNALAVHRGERIHHDLHWRQFIDVVLLPVNMQGKPFTVDAQGKVVKGVHLSAATYTADGCFSLAITDVVEEWLAKVPFSPKKEPRLASPVIRKLGGEASEKVTALAA